MTRLGGADDFAFRSDYRLVLAETCFFMSNQSPRTRLEEDICIHVFTVSAALVGVCLTVIAVLRIVTTASKVDTIADDLVAFDSALFLVSCLSSYWALRTRSTRRLHRVERFADF